MVVRGQLEAGRFYPGEGASSIDMQKVG